MNNYRYDKLNALIYIQNQKSHYKRILEAKKNINFSSMGTTHHPINTSHKHEKSVERERKENNQKLVKRIMEINRKNGLLQNMNLIAKERSKSLKVPKCFQSNRSNDR